MTFKAYYHSPIGWIEIQTSFDAVTSVVFCDSPKNDACTGSATLTNCVRQLDEYFNGRRTTFDVVINQKGTQFQQTVWNALLDIPFGKTVSYGNIAKKINAPRAVRAVGATNGRNKVWIIVPCHRVIGVDGSLTGYAGGLERKQWLLAHEAQVLKSTGQSSPQTQNPKLETRNLKL